MIGTTRKKRTHGSGEQFVLPTQCRASILWLPYSIHMTGHLGNNRTQPVESCNVFSGLLYSEIWGITVGAARNARRHHLGRGIMYLSSPCQLWKNRSHCSGHNGTIPSQLKRAPLQCVTTQLGTPKPCNCVP